MRRRGETEVDENLKSQTTNIKQITMTKIRNFRPVFLVIEYWNLKFVCNLVIGIWDLEMFDNIFDFSDLIGSYELPLATDYYITLKDAL